MERTRPVLRQMGVKFTRLAGLGSLPLVQPALRTQKTLESQGLSLENKHHRGRRNFLRLIGFGLFSGKQML